MKKSISKAEYKFYNFSNAQIYCDEFIDEVAKYFEIGLIGLNEMNNTKIYRNSIYFNCWTGYWNQCAICPLLPKCTKDMVIIPAEDCEEIEKISLQSKEHCGKSIIAKHGDKYIYLGFWCKKYHHLDVCDFTSTPIKAKIFAKLFPRIVKALNLKEIERNTFDGDIKIGGDPEFEEMSGTLYSPKTTRYEDEYYDKEIGKDGAGKQIELRPNPEFEPEKLVNNIKRLIGRISIDKVPISVKGDVFPLGGHIHFGIPHGYLGDIEKIITVLDDFLGRPLVGLSGEARCEYDKLGMYRLKDWGFEYRTLPSAYFLNEEICKIVLKMAKNLVLNTLKNEIEYEIDENKEYGFVVSKQDYLKYGGITETELDRLIDFVKHEYPLYNGKAINANWGFEIKKANIFYENDDYFSPTFIDVFEEEFKYLDYKIYIYRISGEEKQIYGFDFEGYKQTNLKPIFGDVDFGFGVHGTMADSDDEEEILKIAKAIKDKIYDIINGKGE